MAEKEYIERGALLERLKFKRDKSLDLDGRKRCGLDSAIAQVRKSPAADVVEVVHARWEKTYDDPRINKYRCTNCKAEKMLDNYCPNCGAKMDG